MGGRSADGDATVVEGAITVYRGDYTKGTSFVTSNTGDDYIVFVATASAATNNYTAANISQAVVLMDASSVSLSAANFS